MRTFVYVDGFNLYYGALKESSWKWLDLLALFEKVLQPHHDILAIKYFTARVSGTSGDPSKSQRQDVYLRALRHYRLRVEIYFGHFSHKVWTLLAQLLGRQRMAEVIQDRRERLGRQSVRQHSRFPRLRARVDWARAPRPADR